MHSSRMRTTRSSSCLRGGGVCHSAYWDTPPGVGLEALSGVGLETQPQPQARPLNFPLGVGLETPAAQTPQLPPWVWAWRPARHAGLPPPPPGYLQGMLGYHLQCMLGYYHPPMWTEFLTHASENITLPQTSFAGGN